MDDIARGVAWLHVNRWGVAVARSAWERQSPTVYREGTAALMPRAIYYDAVNLRAVKEILLNDNRPVGDWPISQQ